MEAAANWATVRRLRMSWICSENQYFAQCLWWQTCLRTVKIHPFHFHGNLFDSGVLKLWDDVDGCRTKLVTAIRPWKKPVQIIGPFHLVGVFRVSWHNCFSFHLRSIENFPQNRELVSGKHCASPSRFWVYCGGRPMSKVPYELSTLGVVFRDFFQDSEVILASNFKMFMSMKCEVLYQVDWARNDQLEWLRLIFAVYRDPSGSGSVDDTSRITGEVLQKFYSSWGLQPTAVNAALLDQMWSKWYPGIPHTADAILWASSFRFQSVLCWWEVNGIDAVLGIDHSRHTVFLSSIWSDKTVTK